MNQKQIGLRQKVKLGMVTVTEALDMCSPESKTYGWLERRSARMRAALRAQKGVKQ